MHSLGESNFWVIVFMTLLSIIAFFLAATFREIKDIGKNVNNMMVKQAAIDGRLEALEEGKNDFEKRLRHLEFGKSKG